MESISKSIRTSFGERKRETASREERERGKPAEVVTDDRNGSLAVEKEARMEADKREMRDRERTGKEGNGEHQQRWWQRLWSQPGWV